MRESAALSLYSNLSQLRYTILYTFSKAISVDYFMFCFTIAQIKLYTKRDYTAFMRTHIRILQDNETP